MWTSLRPGLSVGIDPQLLGTVSGKTASRSEAVGRRWAWPLVAGSLSLFIWETLWSTSERELVLGDQDLEPLAPVALSKLMSRRRASVSIAESFEYMSARRVDPDSQDWPRLSECRSTDLSQLVPREATEALSTLGYRGCQTRQEILGATGPNRNHYVACFDPGARAASVSFYALTRVVPTLIRIQQLEK